VTLWNVGGHPTGGSDAQSATRSCRSMISNLVRILAKRIQPRARSVHLHCT
jgi:hypothetical protein